MHTIIGYNCSSGVFIKRDLAWNRPTLRTAKSNDAAEPLWLTTFFVGQHEAIPKQDPWHGWILFSTRVCHKENGEVTRNGRIDVVIYFWKSISPRFLGTSETIKLSQKELPFRTTAYMRENNFERPFSFDLAAKAFSPERISKRIHPTAQTSA